MTKRLEGKVAVVTGAGRGIGRGFARALAAEGAKVVVCDLGGADDGTGKSTSPADEVVEEIKRSGGTAAPSYDDVSDFKGAAAIVRGAMDRFGRLDVLITNAGVNRNRYVSEAEEADWDRVMAVHAKGTFNCVRHAAPVMMDQRTGTIITLTSGAFFRGGPLLGAYSAAKGAVYALTLVLAQELRPFNVNVNAISPGVTRTRMVETWLGELKRSRGLSNQEAESTLGEAQDPSNLAPLAVFLCTEEGQRITGRAFQVSGKEISLLSSPAWATSILKPSRGWTVEDLEKSVPGLLGGKT